MSLFFFHRGSENATDAWSTSSGHDSTSSSQTSTSSTHDDGSSYVRTPSAPHGSSWTAHETHAASGYFLSCDQLSGCFIHFKVALYSKNGHVSVSIVFLNYRQFGSMNPMTSAPPRPMHQDHPKISPSVIQAAPTVYTAPPAPKRSDLKSQKQARMVKYQHTTYILPLWPVYHFHDIHFDMVYNKN